MKYQEFDWVGSTETADRVADLLGRAGIRFEQRVVTEPERRTVYVIAVHPDDVARAEEVQSAARQHPSPSPRRADDEAPLILWNTPPGRSCSPSCSMR